MSRRKCELRERAWEPRPPRTYHHVAVDILDDKIAYILDCGIATLFIQHPRGAKILVCRIRSDFGIQIRVCKVDVVRVAGEL